LFGLEHSSSTSAAHVSLSYIKDRSIEYLI
jgi:hypothetical protein